MGLISPGGENLLDFLKLRQVLRTTLWESLMGKPRGKATDPLIHVKGTMTLLLQLGRKSQVHAPTRDED